jgi:serine acetyltransferase
MRKISGIQVLVFLALLAIAILAATVTTALTFDRLPLGDFRGVVLILVGVVFLYIYALLLFRLSLAVCPLQEGEIPVRSRQEFIYHVYLLFNLILFYPITRSSFVPVPLMRLFYQALGGKLGVNTYSSGVIFDPQFVELGDNTIVGQYALLIPHVVEGERLAHYPIRIGSNVTIGAGATVLAGVTIGDSAIVSVGAVVRKSTVIGDGETWGGVPARLLQGPVEKTYARVGEASPVDTQAIENK